MSSGSAMRSFNLRLSLTELSNGLGVAMILNLSAVVTAFPSVVPARYKLELMITQKSNNKLKLFVVLVMAPELQLCRNNLV